MEILTDNNTSKDFGEFARNWDCIRSFDVPTHRVEMEL